MGYFTSCLYFRLHVQDPPLASEKFGQNVNHFL